MNVSPHGALPTAEHGILGQLFGRFRATQENVHTMDLLTNLLILIGLCAGVVVFSRIVLSREKRRTYNHPRALYRDLCRAHRLDRPSRRLLRRLARWHRLHQPAQLFLEPERFDSAIASQALAAQRRRLERLRAKLFAESTPAGSNEYAGHGRDLAATAPSQSSGMLVLHDAGV